MNSIAAVSAAAMALSFAPEAHAAGFYVADHGVRPLGRAGAFVAGGDDLGSISYNPAGVYDAGSAFLFDASYLNFSIDYTREALLRQIDPNTGETVGVYKQTFPMVTGSAPFLPIPTIAGSFSPHPDWVIALGAYAPYAAIPTFPDKVNGQPAPQRYSLLSLDGSLLAIVGAWAGWAPLKKSAPQNLRIGFGLEFLVGQFTAKKVMSGCLPERFFCSPEDPHWDVLSQITAAPIITPSGNVGVQWEFAKGWRLGSSFHLPFWIRAPATVKTRLPSAPVFDRSQQEGEGATITFELPFVARLGIESRDLTPGLRVELDGVYEHWSMHDSINVEPNQIALTNLPGFPQKYFIPDVKIPRGLQNTISVRLGGEYSIKASKSVHVIPRVGVSYETSAVPPENLSVLLVDAAKVTPSVGFGLEIDHIRLDAVFAHVFAETVTVAPDKARLEQTLPLAATAPKNPDYINGGVYSWSANVIGLGMTYTFGHPASPPKPDGKSVPTTEEKPKPVEPVKAPPAPVSDPKAESDEAAKAAADAEAAKADEKAQKSQKGGKKASSKAPTAQKAPNGSPADDEGTAPKKPSTKGKPTAPKK